MEEYESKGSQKTWWELKTELQKDMRVIADCLLVIDDLEEENEELKAKNKIME